MLWLDVVQHPGTYLYMPYRNESNLCAMNVFFIYREDWYLYLFQIIFVMSCHSYIFKINLSACLVKMMEKILWFRVSLSLDDDYSSEN